MDRIEAAIASARADEPEVVGYHKLRARHARAGGAISTSTSSSAAGTSLESAHTSWRISSATAIEADLGNAEVLIHVEPESSRHDPAESP